MWKLFLVVLPILLITFPASVSSQSVEKKICQTTECLSAAQNLKNSINFDANPCDDFYKYACGNWPKHRNNSDSKSQSTVTLRVEENKAELLDYLKQNNSDDEPEAVHKARKFLSSCTNGAGFSNKVEQIETTLQKIGLPSLFSPSNGTENFDYITALARADRLAGIKLYFDFGIEPNTYDLLALITTSFSNKITVKKPKEFNLNMTEQDYMNKVMEKICKNNTSTSCIQWFSPLNSTKASIIETLSNHTKEMNAIIKGLSFSPTTLTLKELQDMADTAASYENTLIPKWNWTKYIEEMFAGLDNVTLNLSDPKKVEIVAGKGRSFISNMLEFLHRIPSTKIIELTLWWKVVGELLPFIDSEMFDMVNSPKTRQEHCEELTMSSFSMASSYLYAKKDKYIEAKTEIGTMVQHIRESFQEILQKATWMDEITKQRALKKLETMKSYIVYPDIIKKTSILNDNYKEVQLSDNFYDMMTSTIQNQIVKQLKTFNQTYDIYREIKNPTNVNALYTPIENTMIIPAAIIGTQSIYYSNGIRALNYGGIGSIIGHEMTHGFDNNGRRYNETGMKEDWWQPETDRMYKEKIKCFVDAYDHYKTNYSGNELWLPSEFTLGEDISDNTGFKESLLAYKRCVNVTGEEPLLPQFENFTHEQLLTLAFGNVWCGNKEAAAGSRYDEHSPSVIRVNGVLRNSKEFAEIWNCPKGSNMNPNKDKCSIW